jgi:parallel beta-helix repeat protein
MQENGVDLVGNLPAGLRLPLVEATKQEIRLPDPAYPSLQHAVDALLPGGRLILARGAYAGGVTIEKDLTIEALEGAEARLEGGTAVISLVGAARVKLAGLLLTGSSIYGGLAGGATVQVEITGSTISGNRDDGIVLWDTAQAKITNSTISENWTGIELRGTAQVEITNSTISKNEGGIVLGDSARAKITSSTISENGAKIGEDGIRLSGTARVEITNSTISRNQGNGIELSGTAQAEITNSTISGNRWAGIWLEDSAQAKITDSTISGNRLNGIWLWDSARAKITSSTISENDDGIVLWDSAQAEITTSTISDNEADGIHLLEKAILRLTESHLLRNQGYGVRAYLPGCVEDSQSELRFTGEVSGRGNTIPGPAEPDGNKKGAVCPAELAFLMTKEGGKYP